MRLKGSIVIGLSGRKFLMVRHSQRAWEFPGGRLEHGESPQEAAKREFFEETGLQGTSWQGHGIASLDGGDLAIFSCRVSAKPAPQTPEITASGYFTAPPIDLSFPRHEYFRLLAMAGRTPKPKTDYDIASRDFDSLRGRTATDMDWTGAIQRWGRISVGARVLDIGCGTGRHSLGLAMGCGAEICGMDLSAGMLSKANSKSRGCWLRADATHLPITGGGFDATMMILVLQHVDDEPLAISEAFRVLRPGGRLLVATISHARIMRHVTRLFPGLAKIDLDRFMPVPELKRHMRGSGFVDIGQHMMRTQERVEPVEELLDRFRRRYISTLALVPENDFEAGLATFEMRLRERYGPRVATDVEITFLDATKPYMSGSSRMVR
jgi:ubiquinone/menaquinone biosynthesis C-methylase UbiE